MLMSDIDIFWKKLKFTDDISVVTTVSWQDIINLRRSKSDTVVS